jgi:dynactin complex subunit
VKIYKKAISCIRNLLTDPENSSSKSEIKRLNKQIKELNKKHNTKVKKLKEKKLEGYYKAYYIKEDIFVIRDFNILKSIGLEASKAVKSLEKDPKSKRVKIL